MLLRETSLDESRLRRLFPPLAYYSWCAATLIAAVSGPFGTFQVMDFPVRLVFWAVILGTCISVGRVVRVGVVATLFGVLGFLGAALYGFVQKGPIEAYPAPWRIALNNSATPVRMPMPARPPAVFAVTSRCSENITTMP